MFDISCESDDSCELSARQRIHMNQALLFSEKKKKEKKKKKKNNQNVICCSCD